MSSDSKKSSYLDLVKACDNFPYDSNIDELYKLYLPDDDRVHGYMLPEIVSRMPWTPEFTITQDPPLSVQLHPLDPTDDYSSTCTAAFAQVINRAITSDLFSTLHGSHSEPYSIPGSKSPIHLERHAAPLFGTICRGAHLTLFTRDENDDLKIWIAKRSAHLFTYPGKLDTTVAGGIRARDTPLETLIHEADEEASLPPSLIESSARSTGLLTYMKTTGTGSGGIKGLITGDMIYVYDLEVSASITPKPRDDEVEGFYLWDVEKVKEELMKGNFKTNSAVVMIDFFIRHGVIRPEDEGDYAEIVMRMHRKLPFPTGPGS